MKTLDNFLSKTLIVENEIKEDYLYLIPGSNNFNVAYGFLKHGIPYVIRLSEITNVVSAGLWELKISKLKYSKDLKEYKSDQASVDKHSLDYYIKAIEFVLDQLPTSIRIKIRGLLFNFPQTTHSAVISFLRKSLTKMFVHSLPGIKNIESPLQSNPYKWIFAYRDVKLETIFTEFKRTNIDDFNILDAVNTVFVNPTIYVPLKTIKRITDFSQFPEIEQFEKINEDDIKSNDHFLLSLLSIKKSLNKDFEYVSGFIDNNEETPFINYFANVDVLEHALEDDDNKQIYFARVTRIKRTKEYYDTILHLLNTPYKPNFLRTFIRRCVNFINENNTNRDFKELEKHLDSKGLFTFLSFCRNFITEARKKNTTLMLNVEKTPFMDFPYTGAVNKTDPETFEETFKKITKEIDKWKGKEQTIRFLPSINYSLDSVDFFTALRDYKESFVKFQPEQIKVYNTIQLGKKAFDEIVKMFDKNFQRGFKLITDTFYENKLKHLQEFAPEFYSYILHFLKVQENAGNINFDRDLFLEEKYLHFNFDKEYDFIEHYFDSNPPQEQKTFNVLLTSFCKLYDMDVAKIKFSSEFNKITEELIYKFKFDPSHLQDEFEDGKKVIDNFKEWMVEWLKEESKNKQSDNTYKPKPSKFIEHIKEQLDNPNDENRLEILKYKQKLLEKTIFHTPIVDSIDPKELTKLLAPFENSYSPLVAVDPKADYDHKDIDNELGELFYPVWNNEKHRSAINQYTNDPVANNFFRGKTQSYQESALNQVMVFLDPTTPKLKDNLITIRGSKSDKWLSDRIAGDYVVEPGFLSTTISQEAAFAFAGSTGVYYLFYLPKNTSGLYVEQITEIKTEYEFLLPPGSVFRILSIESRVSTEKTVLNGKSGLIYSLLLVNTITDSICESLFNSPDEQDMIKKIKEGK